MCIQVGLLAFTCASGAATAVTHGSPQGCFLSHCEKLIFGKFTSVHRVRPVLAATNSARASSRVFSEANEDVLKWGLLNKEKSQNLWCSCWLVENCFFITVTVLLLNRPLIFIFHITCLCELLQVFSSEQLFGLTRRLYHTHP